MVIEGRDQLLPGVQHFLPPQGKGREEKRKEVLFSVSLVFCERLGFSPFPPSNLGCFKEQATYEHIEKPNTDNLLEAVSVW